MQKEVEKNALPLPRALLYVLFSVVVIWGTLFLSWWYHDYIVKKRKSDDKFIIEGMVTSCSSQDFLSPDHLASLIGLEKKKVNLYAFDPTKAEHALTSFAPIRSCSVRRLRPNAVLISYEMRRPKYRLVDFEDVALDEQGYPFFLTHVYSPKRLVELYLGITQLTGQKPIGSGAFVLAKELLAYVEAILPTSMRICRVDTHRLHASSRGLQELVVVLEDAKGKRYLRLRTTGYKKNLSHFVALLPTLDSMYPEGASHQIVDLRGNGFLLVK